jgi:hypothetical protein
MNWLGVAFVAVLAAIVAYLMMRNRREKSSDRIWRSFPVPGFGLVSYDETEMSQAEAELLAMQLRKISAKLWVKLCNIYGKIISNPLEKVRFDKQFTWEGKPSGGKCWRREMRMVLRPRGHGSLDCPLYFAFELHNLYRGWALGFDKYLPEPGDDSERFDEAVKACKELAK